jgi:hypothetical protein
VEPSLEIKNAVPEIAVSHKFALVSEVMQKDEWLKHGGDRSRRQTRAKLNRRAQPFDGGRRPGGSA